MWTLRLLFFGNYPSLNGVFMCCHCTKKPEFNYDCVLFKHSNFCSRMLEMHSKKPRFQIFLQKPAPYKSEFSPLHLFQSFSHLPKILLKTLMDPCPSGKWALKVTCLAKKSTCPRLSDSALYEHWSVGKHCIWCITCGACLLLLFYADLFPDGTYFWSKYSW